MSNIPIKYNPSKVEGKWYKYWLKNQYFKSLPNQKKAYTIVMPPPNVTGILHMGHMLNNTIQDILIRRARMNGYNACWVPGTDHASIATEAKVVARLRDKGIEKSDLNREEFLDYAWQWTKEYGGVILDQLKKLGVSCDWDRTKFTMDKSLSDSVIKVFVSLYKKGLIYKGYKMINWDPQAKTTVSDEEVIYIEKTGKLFYIKYQIEGTQDFIIVATTRPETILGDTAVCINPNDQRYQHLKGKKVIVPICERSVPIIQDKYVDIDFGTGCLKITPAHDPNDNQIGQEHNLKVIDIFNDDATLNENGLHYQGKDRFVVRKEIVKELEEKGLLQKIEKYKNKIGTSERTSAIIEPKISYQWFLKMEYLATPALKAVVEDEIELLPKKFKNTYKHWLENIRDWNISRQLWWGHQIPAYYYGEGSDDFVVAQTKEEALSLVIEKTGNKVLTIQDLKQDEDVLDTWFSSWLWPISVFNGISNPNNEEVNYYYPTQELVTAPDIIFFWVARMVMLGYHYRDMKPFKKVYFTGVVRDKKGQKMSKSLGNSPDPMELMDRYGADAVRVGLILCTPAGNDLLFDESLCMQGRNFANKIWNAFRLIKSWKISEDTPESQNTKVAIDWFKAKLKKTSTQLNKSYDKYRISEALMTLYKLIWDDFCSWYLEMIKPEYGHPIDKNTYLQTVSYFENLLEMLHPFMPFITEEIWQLLEHKSKQSDSIVISQLSKIENTDASLITQFDKVAQVITNIRNIRKQKNIPHKEKLELVAIVEQKKNIFDYMIIKLCNLDNINYTSEKVEEAHSFRVGVDEYFMPFAKDTINIVLEIEKLNKELSYYQGFLSSAEKKLSNEKFVNNAPEKVVALEKKKHTDAKAKINIIQKRLEELQDMQV